MTRKEFLTYVVNKYGTQAEYLWKKHPNFAVLRHQRNKKWYAILMDVEKAKLGLAGSGKEELLNLKLPSELILILQEDERFLPAYHMNKIHWISLRIEKFSFETLAAYVENSFELTK